MFCKFCGQSIPDASEFCPECGKKLRKKEVTEPENHRGFSTPLALMLIMLCWNTVYAWGRVLLFGYQATVGVLISTVMLIIGLVLLVALVSRERIHGDSYRFSDLLPLCCVWMVIPGLLMYLKLKFPIHMFGQSAYSAWLIWDGSMIEAIRFPAFWLVLGIIALGLSRRGNCKPTKQQQLILLVFLFACSALGFVFARVLAGSMGAPEEVIYMTVRTSRLWTVLCWLWPLVILKVFRTLGEGRIGTGGAIASLLGMQLGEVFLLPIFVFVLDLGVAGCALANGLAPLFGLLILRMATLFHKKNVKR